jgi:hypothetical protein
MDILPLPERSVHDTNPAWSAVHNLIAYYHYINDGKDSLNDIRAYGLRLVNPDGTNDTLFYEGLLRWQSLDWAPDGNCLLVRNEYGLLKISYPDKIIDTLRGPGDPMAFDYLCASFSPDGSKIVTVTNGGDERGVYLMNSDGSDYHKLVKYGEFPAWASVDSIIYINHDYEFPFGTICLTDTAGTFRRLVYNHENYFQRDLLYTRIHIATRRMVIYGPRDDDYPADLWKMEPGWQEVAHLTPDGEYPCFSPDGNRVVYTYEKKGYGNLWIVNWDGSGAHPLTD